MTSRNFDYAFRHLVGHESAKVSMRPTDNGNWTGARQGVGQLVGSKYGVTPAVLRKHRRLNRDITREEMAALGEAEAKEIFRIQYWDAVKADRLPSGLDYAVADYAYNSGPAQAVESLQRLVGAVPDGVVGINTLNGVDKQASVSALIKRYQAARLAFMKRLKGWKEYGKGWERRVREVERLALNMVRQGTPAIRDAPPPPPTEAPARPSDTRWKFMKGVRAAISTVAAALVAGSEMLTSGLAGMTGIPYVEKILVAAVVVGAIATVIVLIRKPDRTEETPE